MQGLLSAVEYFEKNKTKTNFYLIKMEHGMEATLLATIYKNDKKWAQGTLNRHATGMYQTSVVGTFKEEVGELTETIYGISIDQNEGSVQKVLERFGTYDMALAKHIKKLDEHAKINILPKTGLNLPSPMFRSLKPTKKKSLTLGTAIEGFGFSPTEYFAARIFDPFGEVEIFDSGEAIDIDDVTQSRGEGMVTTIETKWRKFEVPYTEKEVAAWAKCIKRMRKEYFQYKEDFYHESNSTR